MREKRIGKAVPTSATAIAPAIRYVVPSDDTSPTAETTVKGLFLVFLSLVFQDETFAAPVNVDAEQNPDRDGFLVDCAAGFLVEVSA